MVVQQHWHVLLTFAGALIAAVGVAAGALHSSRSEQRYQESLNRKNEEIIALQQTLFGELTGGDSYVVVGVGSGMMFLEHHGDYPVYDLTLTWVDTQDVHPRADFNEIMRQRHEVKVGNVYPHFAAMLPLPNAFVLAEQERKAFNLFFQARNGYRVQRLHVVRVGDRMLYATQVTKGFSPIMKLHEKVDENFPAEILEQDHHWLKD